MAGADHEGEPVQGSSVGRLWRQADPRIPLDQVAQFQDALVQAGVPHRLVICAGAEPWLFRSPCQGVRRRSRPGLGGGDGLSRRHAVAGPHHTGRARAASESLGCAPGAGSQFTGAVWLAELQAGQPAGGANIYTRVL